MKILILLLLLSNHLIANLCNLEEDLVQDFVLESKRIQIPNFPYAFNPSIVRWNGFYLMSFRAGKEYSYNFEEPNQCPRDEFPESRCAVNSQMTAHPYSPNRIGLVWLDEDFHPIANPQILDIPNFNSTYRQQDPRLVTVGDQIFIIYSDVVPGLLIAQTRRMVVAELQFDGERFSTKNTEYLCEYEGEIESRWEKNWVPFDYENKLLLSYGINPHKVLYPLLEQTGACSTIASTVKKLGWHWGELRGGTPALLENEDSYLAFFHSSIVMDSAQSNGKKMQHYFMGAYTFSSQPPFSLQTISPAPIVGKDFYNGPKYQTWKPVIVVFPGGMVIKGDYIYVAYGRQDHEMWITKLDRQKLLASMVPVSNE